MSLCIIEIHPATDERALNTEWFILENRGEAPFHTKNCALVVSRPGSKKKTELGTIDPGFSLAPGQQIRVVTGNPGRKAHGEAPRDGVDNYNLFLGAVVLKGAGTTLALSLRSRILVTATFDPKAGRGVRDEGDPV